MCPEQGLLHSQAHRPTEGNCLGFSKGRVGDGPPRLASSMSHCPPPFPWPPSPTHLHPQSLLFLPCLKTKLPIEKQSVDLQVLQLANPSVPGSAGLWRRAQAWAQCPGLSFVTSQEPGDPPSPLKGPFLSFLPAQICLVAKSCLVFKFFYYYYFFILGRQPPR